VQFADVFATPVKAAYLTFIGPLIGSLIRPVGGILADRLGGARVSFVNFVAMALGAVIVLVASMMQSLPLYLVGFIMLFTFSGVGNGSVYKMIPAIFRAKSGLEITRHGFSASPLTQVTEVPSARAQLRAQLGLVGYPHVLLRIGRAPVTPASRRRRLVDVLVEES